MLELEHDFRIVDVHARLDPERGMVADRRPVGSDRLQRELRQAGIVRAVVFPGRRTDGYLRANNAVARMSVERPFAAFARLSGPRDPASRLRTLTARRQDHHTAPGAVEQYAYDDRFAGFKLHPPDDGLPDEETMAALADVELPVLVHGGRGFPPTAVADLLECGFPTIVAHFGGHPLDRGMMWETVDLLDRHDNCYLDTAAVRYRDIVEHTIREHPDRVLFGSGTPDSHPSVAVTEMLTLDITEDAMAKVLSKNLQHVGDGSLYR